MATGGADQLRLRVRGRLDADEAGRLRAVLEDVEGDAAVRLDLSRSGPLPVDVLRALATASRRLDAGGGTVLVQRPSPAAALSLRTSGLHRVLRIEGWPAPCGSAHLPRTAGA
jgi:hypothetical protein